MERRKNADLIRERLYPEMRELFDIAVEIYRHSEVKPKLEEETDETGLIKILRFNKVPPAVMSKLFEAVKENEGRVSCGYSLDYQMKKTSEVILNTFEIRKTQDKPLYETSSGEIDSD